MDATAPLPASQAPAPPAPTRAPASTATIDQAAAFLNAIFVPGDCVLIRPIETWTEAGKKISRVDYGGGHVSPPRGQ
jgi:hypothetical protein